jgi:hypothetical protein
VATAISINDLDANGDSATDITARLKTGAIFTIAKDAANYVRYEVTVDFASGAAAVTVRAEQGTIASGDTVFLAIASDAPTVSSGGGGGSGLTWSVVTASTSAAAANNGYFANLNAPQRFTLPSAPALADRVAVLGVNTGLHELTNGLIFAPNGLSDVGIRATSGNPRASIDLICTDPTSVPKRWGVLSWSNIAHYELFDPGGYSVEALAVINAIEATGLTLTSTQKNAVNSRISAFQANSEWADLIAYYGSMGGTANAHAINWKTPGTNNLTFSGSISHNASGIGATSGNALANTGIATTYANFPTTG